MFRRAQLTNLYMSSSWGGHSAKLLSLLIYSPRGTGGLSSPKPRTPYLPIALSNMEIPLGAKCPESPEAVGSLVLPTFRIARHCRSRGTPALIRPYYSILIGEPPGDRIRIRCKNAKQANERRPLYRVMVVRVDSLSNGRANNYHERFSPECAG